MGLVYKIRGFCLVSMSIVSRNELLGAVGAWNFWERNLETGVGRESYVEELLRLIQSNQVVVVSGVRRSGKSYILRQAAKKLIDQGRRPQEVVIVNFEDVRLEVENSRDLQQLYEIIEAHLGGGGQRIIFLDEVQKVEGWEAWARTMHELRKAKIVVSGSNSKLLSKEMGTELTGRHLDLAVYPLSLAEFVRFKKGSEAKFYLRNFLKEGGFPLAVLEPQMGEELLPAYFEDILRRDVIDRYAVCKKSGLVAVAKYIVGDFSSRMTFGSMAKFLDLTPVTVRQFVDYLEEAFLAFAVNRYDRRPKLVEKSPRKVYCVDTGLANVVAFGTGQNLGRQAENAVYLELRRRKRDVFYWKDERNREVDFVTAGRGEKEAIQVCWEVTNYKTREREVKSLAKGLVELDWPGGTILTEDFVGQEVVDGKWIKYRRLWEWLVNLE